MLVDDLPAAVALTLEHVGKAGADRRPNRPSGHGEDHGTRAQPVCTLRSVLRVGCAGSNMTAPSAYWRMMASTLPVVNFASACSAILVASAGVTAAWLVCDCLQPTSASNAKIETIMRRMETLPSRAMLSAYAAFFKCLRPSSSAICTAFSAAPLRRLSLTTHRLRPFSTVESSRILLT